MCRSSALSSVSPLGYVMTELTYEPCEVIIVVNTSIPILTEYDLPRFMVTRFW